MNPQAEHLQKPRHPQVCPKTECVARPVRSGTSHFWTGPPDTWAPFPAHSAPLLPAIQAQHLLSRRRLATAHRRGPSPYPAGPGHLLLPKAEMLSQSPPGSSTPSPPVLVFGRTSPSCLPGGQTHGLGTQATQNFPLTNCLLGWEGLGGGGGMKGCRLCLTRGSPYLLAPGWAAQHFSPE